jgi:hypothetical protein
MTRTTRFALIAGSILAAAFPAFADVNLPANALASGAFIAAPGESISLCSFSFGVTHLTTLPAQPVTVSLEILDGVSGAVLMQNQITLPPLGSPLHPPDPCITYQVPPLTTSAVPPEGTLFIGAVLVNPQPGFCPTCPSLPGPPPGVGLMASVNVYTPDTSGLPTNVRFIPVLHPPNPCML